MKNRILKSGLVRLVEARKIGSKLSREEIKKQGLEAKLISSARSFELHEKNWSEFADWCFKNYKTRKLNQVKPEMLKKFVQEKARLGGRDGQGATRKTLQAYISAVNKVMLISGRWKEVDKPTLTKWKDDILIRDDYQKGYKHLTGEEWIKRNPDMYLKFQDLIDTVRAFGLRMKEVNELNQYSFIQDQKGKMYVQTIGKGGKYRIAECTHKLNERMNDLYAHMAQKIDRIENHQGVRNSKAAETYLESVIRNQTVRLNLSGVHSSRVPKHIFRSLYARELLQEKINQLKDYQTEYRGYSTFTRDELRYSDLSRFDIQIGAYKGNAEAFRFVSQNLGHNRLDVLLKYL